MKRDILFRGKMAYDGDEWAIGDLRVKPGGECQIFVAVSPNELNSHYVLKETVGQYTGLRAKDFTPIFEGDILRYVEDGYDDPAVEIKAVVWKDGAFYWGEEFIGDLSTSNDFEVIGNIHDHPELLDADDRRKIFEGVHQ
jgi:hypothetical protein